MILTRYLAFNIVAIFLGTIAFVGNAMICHVIIRLKTMKTSINYIILNLAVLDAMTGLFSVSSAFVHDHQGVFGKPLLVRAYNHSSTLADVICKAQSMIWFPFNVSPVLLTIMAYERYKAIVYPLSRLDDSITKARLKWMLPLASLLGAMYTVFDMIAFRYDPEASFCELVFVDMPSWWSHKIVIICYLITQGLIPSTTMLLFYGRIICALQRQNNALGPQAEAERARRKAKKNVMWIVIAVTLMFYICCGVPNAFYTVYVFSENLLSSDELMSDFEKVLVALNAAFNPFAYFIFMKSFRDGFRRVFLFRKRNTAPNNDLELNTCPQRSFKTERQIEDTKL